MPTTCKAYEKNIHCDDGVGECPNTNPNTNPNTYPNYYLNCLVLHGILFELVTWSKVQFLHLCGFSVLTDLKKKLRTCRRNFNKNDLAVFNICMVQ